jgi:hypothetical protein
LPLIIPALEPWPQVLRARDAPDAAYEVFCRTPGVPLTDLRVRVFPPDSLLIEVRAAAADAPMTDVFLGMCNGRVDAGAHGIAHAMDVRRRCNTLMHSVSLAPGIRQSRSGYPTPGF